jgi:hypothetical protein
MQTWTDAGQWLRSGLATLRTRDDWSRGKLVVCPGARATALVETNAEGEVQRCSRWPGRGGCAMECRGQHASVAERSLLERVVEEWYAERPCARCGHRFDGLHWDDRAPALRTSDGRVVRWRDLDPEDTVGVLASHDPLCVACAARLLDGSAGEKP